MKHGNEMISILKNKKSKLHHNIIIFKINVFKHNDTLLRESMTSILEKCDQFSIKKKRPNPNQKTGIILLSVRPPAFGVDVGGSL